MLKLTENQNTIIDKALTTYGAEEQLKKLVEELTELSLVLQHGASKGYNKEDVYSETADVFICLQYLLEIFEEQGIQQEIDNKILRLQNKLKDLYQQELASNILMELEGMSFSETVKFCECCKSYVPNDDMHSTEICKECSSYFKNI